MSLAERRMTFDARVRRDTRIGAAVLLVILGCVYLVFGGPLPFRSHYEIEAVVSSTNELRPGSAVRIAGVNVGKVVGLRRGDGTTGIVRMRIDDRGRPVHRDATLKIRPRLFLEGNFFVDLKPGTSAAPELGDGGVIPLGQTAIPVQFDQVLTALNADARGSLTSVLEEYAAALRGGGAQAVNEAFGPSAGAFKGLALVSRGARGLTEHDLSELIRDGERVMRALEDRKRDLQGLVTNYARTASALAADTGALADTVGGLAATMRTAGPALRDLNDALPQTRAFARDLRPLLRRAPRTLDLAVGLVGELDRLVAPDVLPPLLDDARPALRDLAAIVPDLQGLLGKVTPVADCVRNNVLPTLRTPVDDGPHTTGLPPWRELLNAMVGLASAAQNFDGNGPAVRYMAGFGEQLFSTGKVPGAGQLFGSGPAPLLGSRPRRPATGKPPFRPDVACATQDKPDLQADTMPAPRSRKIRQNRPSGAEVTKHLRAAIRRARKLAAKERRP